MRFKFPTAGALAVLLLLASIAGAAPSGAEGQRRQHFIYWGGTPQELHVYKIYGRFDGPTVMIIGGIQGDEPGGYLSADSYADLAVRRGNLIVVPRANFKAVVMNHRGPDGDMNRKFQGELGKDSDRKLVEILKSLMAESDLVLNLHDGSGYYRPTWESELANPNRYGQCIIADADVYTHPVSGRILPLQDYALDVVNRVNQEIDEPIQKFHFFNTRTDEPDSKHKEQRGSVTYYCLTQLGIPAFGVETSKVLPSLELKVYQHNLAVNAFLDVFGLELEQPRISLEPAALNHLIVSVNDTVPLALADGQTLQVAPGDTIKVLNIGANYSRGLAVKVTGQGDPSFNDLGLPLRIDKPTAITVFKDRRPIGRVAVEFLPAGADTGPRVIGLARINPYPQATYIYEESDSLLAGLDRQSGAGQPIGPPPAGRKPPETQPDSRPEGETPDQGGAAAPEEPGGGRSDLALRPGPGQVTGFLVEVDGQEIEIAPGQELEILSGSLIKMVDLKSNGELPKKVVMNLRGYMPKSKAYKNDGEDRGFTADTGQEMMPEFSEGQKGRVYKINAEVGKDVIAFCTVKLIPPQLASVTIEVEGRRHTLKLGGRLPIAPGTEVTVLNIELAGGRTLSNPRFTLGGKEFPADLPQTLTMPGYGANLAVFNGATLAGKVLWALPQR